MKKKGETLADIDPLAKFAAYEAEVADLTNRLADAERKIKEGESL